MSGSQEEYSFLSVSYLCSGSLGGGWTASVPREEVWTFPSYCVSAAGGALTDTEAMHHLVSCVLGWRLSAVILPDWIGDVVKFKYLTSLVQIRSCDCHSLLPAKCVSPHTWDFWEFLTFVSQTLLHWICIFALFKQLFDYLACLSSEL